jgi:hypothetical protein
MKTTIYTETCDSYELTREQFIIFLEYLWIESLDNWRIDLWNNVLDYECKSKHERKSQLNINYSGKRCLIHWNYESDFGGTKYYFNATKEYALVLDSPEIESFHVAIERDGEKSHWLKSIVNYALTK